MPQIIDISEETIKIGKEDGSIESVPADAVKYENPQVGDKVKIFKNDGAVIVTRFEEEQQPPSEEQAPPEQAAQEQAVPNPPAGVRVNIINKHIFVWIGTFFFGSIGVDRFMRGQIGLGILKIITGGAVGIWTLVDFIVALVKLYGAEYSGDTDVKFLDGKYAK